MRRPQRAMRNFRNHRKAGGEFSAGADRGQHRATEDHGHGAQRLASCDLAFSVGALSGVIRTLRMVGRRNMLCGMDIHVEPPTRPD